MDSRTAFRCSMLSIALLSLLLGALSCSGGGAGGADAPARPDVLVAAEPGDAAPAGDGLAAMQRHIAQREYRASYNSNGLQAPNRVNNLRTYFSPNGIRVHDRTRAGSPELLALNLTGIGRGETLAAVGFGEVKNDGARVEIHRPELIEWYENSPAGLKQGFTLEERPAGDGPLRLELAVDGGEAALRGDAVVFKTATGRRLRYSKLVATDVDGTQLTARIEVPTPDRLQLWIDDSDAVYPLTIDPILTAMSDTQLESNQADAQLGVSVSGAGDVNGDGYADVIVGAFFYDAGQADEGAAFVFLGSAAGVADGNASTAHAQLESNQAGAFLGISVSGAGDVNGDGFADVIVGAYNYDAGESNEGAAFVFLGSATGIANGNPSTAHAQLESNQIAAFLGFSVSGAGDVNGDGYADVIVGAYLYDAGEFDEGAAFVFLGSATGIADGNPSTAHAQLESNQGFAFLGNAVSGAGDVNGDGYADVIVGAYFYDAGQADEGAAFVFLGSATGVADGNPSTAHAQLESDQADAGLGRSVSGAGDVNGDGYADVIVGAAGVAAGEFNEGAAFVFLGGTAGVADGNPSTAHAQLQSDQAGAFLGFSVSGAGDVNGDGYADVIVGAHFYSAGQGFEGAAFVFLGSATGIADGNPSTAHAQLESNQGFALLGNAVSDAGDVNGDGFADVIVGAILYDAAKFDEGAAFVYLPEPSAIVSLLLGMALLSWLYRRRRNPM